MEKYTPPRRISTLKTVGAALHLGLPGVGLWRVLAQLEGPARAHWFLWLAAAAGYLIYLVFAILLHKERYPEKPGIAIRLTFAPLVGSLLYFKYLAASVSGWLAAAGMAYFLGVTIAIWALFACGPRLALADPAAGPGESRLRWRAEGHSPLLDPKHSLPVRATNALVFVLPGLLAAGIILFHAFAGENGGAWPILMLLTVAAFHAWQCLRQLVGVVADGRFFGPGSTAFD